MSLARGIDFTTSTTALRNNCERKISSCAGDWHLGLTSEERKAVLDAIREELRRRDYLPILFDFDKPANRDLTETISPLARMAARFIVADITDAKAIAQELNVIVPDLPSVPVQPLLLRESSEFGMFGHYARYPWVLPLYRYETPMGVAVLPLPEVAPERGRPEQETGQDGSQQETHAKSLARLIKDWCGNRLTPPSFLWRGEPCAAVVWW